VEHVPALAVVHDDAEAPECQKGYIFSMKDSR
jgi:RecJ-like exonuclease